MFKKNIVWLIVAAVLMLLASPALAQDRVNKLVIRNNLKEGRQFEAVFEPGTYILHPRTAGHPDGIFHLYAINNPSPACFIRGGHNAGEPVDEANRLRLASYDSTWGYFELGDVCYLRFEIRDYGFGAVNIRRVTKVKTIQLNADWQEVTFGAGRWSGSAINGDFQAQIRPGNASQGCSYHAGSNGMQYGIYPGSVSGYEEFLSPSVAFVLDEPCVLWLRAVDVGYDFYGNLMSIELVSHDVATFAKSR
ncbi:MAG: hypothetical protein OXG92_09255 [Chloroflexi bacterium]|nr:hypothetical protein [Chloroflexota bacterium]MCY3581005.1 hypothetical protein [Chloroflexota bacterium]MCY3716634.1 hypothetical protein [Chloroflexota bacterium]MDE2650497.1 hypothetical protein [Chloroflexota bacterium]MXV92409.1 hypothetical protein [Chloroflexota bacterium]